VSTPIRYASAATVFRSDGTPPTAAIGVFLPVSSTTLPFIVMGAQLLAAVRFIPTTGSATLNVEYYR
jgi:hypothetical protein